MGKNVLNALASIVFDGAKKVEIPLKLKTGMSYKIIVEEEKKIERASFKSVDSVELDCYMFTLYPERHDRKQKRPYRYLQS